ncbi:MAG: hypothetical protein J7639_32480 [Paenibacillaceae bacterium]|uniref:hypothetical protein n=1 Tax=Paenibacillus cymbidii TaxID=1639034 RepID=UPI00108107D8|nr:hypothetical protein [Paenibacillus cymbidii]MBO9610715.1 hypothetical protein [Paenibacillaceae bacterium]
MLSVKRCQIRIDVLQELYQFHLMERGKKALIPQNLADRNPEKFFALEYLADKRLIRFKTEDDGSFAKITASGIKQIKNVHKGLNAAIC